ncbi:MAG: molecular chaperone TorD family protein [Thermodesulfobacteriota bacterium]
MNQKVIEPEVFQALSRLFSYPENLPDTGAFKALLPAPDVPEACDPGKMSLTALQNQYVRLFINAYPEAPCPPYGSYYLEGVIMGPSTIILEQLYQSYGFETGEPADHIAVELEFLALLSLMLRQAGEGEESERILADYRFVLEHLRSWLALFFKSIQSVDDAGCYLTFSGYVEKVFSIM